jgi:2-keto-4-pentenoate hydratase/2-oxohepta-3-ene-1,7-dioic acid hydratase in catechol pathway
MQVVPRLVHGPSTTAHFRRRMKLIRFGEPRSEKPGVLVNDRRLDLSSESCDWDGAFFSSGGLGSLGDLLRSRSPESFPEVPRSMRWGAPIARPGKIVCIGLNFTTTRVNRGWRFRRNRSCSLKATNTVVGPNDDLLIPRRSKRTDWEIERGVILGKEARYLASPDEVPGVMKLGMKRWVNDQLRQNGNTGAMIFGPAHPDRPRDGRVDI